MSRVEVEPRFRGEAFCDLGFAATRGSMKQQPLWQMDSGGLIGSVIAQDPTIGLQRLPQALRNN